MNESKWKKDRMKISFWDSGDRTVGLLPIGGEFEIDQAYFTNDEKEQRELFRKDLEKLLRDNFEILGTLYIQFGDEKGSTEDFE